MAKSHQSNGYPALLYHRVGPTVSDDPHGLTVPMESFKAQVEWLARKKYETLPSLDWWHAVRSGEPAGKKLLLTFDDAYADIATHALPVLHAHGFSALIFVVTGSVGMKDHWNGSSLPLMSEEQIRLWSGRGFEFASHSHSHRDLTLLTAPEIDAEIRDSDRVLRALVGRPAPTFAYPYGYVSDLVVAAVRSQYQFAFSTESGLNDIHADAHLLRRSMVLPKDSLFEFSMRVRRGRNDLTPVRSLLSPIKKLLAGAS